MKRLPIGREWDAAKNEKNWGLFLIGAPDARGKSAKIPVDRRGSPTKGGAEAVMVLNYAEAVNAQQILTVSIDQATEHIEAINTKLNSKARFPLPVAFCVGYMARDRSIMVIHDFDNCRDPNTGKIDPALATAMGETYAEVSVSGTGIHELTLRLPSDEGCRERAGFGRYAGPGKAVALTFDHIESTPETIAVATRTRELVDQRLSSEKKVTTTALRRLLPEDQHDLTSIPSILADLPNPAMGYDEWMKMAIALRAAANAVDPPTAVLIEQAFYDWSDRWEGGFPTEDAAKKWSSIKVIRQIGPGSFFFLARELGWSPRQKVISSPPRLSMIQWLLDASNGDPDALQRLARFMLSELQEDAVFTLITALGKIGRIADVEKIINTEEMRATRIADQMMQEVLK